ncbi:MAG: hypothetical protein EBQ92_09335 [Proteobacteria bacterium]|nr:hypothetical protein [Pseudomonadota bacterium]
MRQSKLVWGFFQVFSALLIISCGRTSQPTKITFKVLSGTSYDLVKNALQREQEKLPQKKGRVRTQTFRLAKPVFKRLKTGTFLPQLANAKIVSAWGRPRVPMMSYVFTVPQGQKAHLSLEKPQFEISEDKIELTKASKPLVWGKKQIEFREPELGDYFPGKLFESHQIGNTVYVSVFPMQVETKTGKVLSLVEGNWELRLVKTPEKQTKVSHKPALIVTSEKLLAGAKELQQFHQEVLKTESEIATVESIAKETSPIDEKELPEGYKNPEEFDGVVRKFNPEKGTGYDFTTAKKIISFLRKRSDEDSRFRYVVLLGNSENVPPSYYFSDKEGFDEKGVTDQCYGAGKMCVEPRLAVGRLPFSSDQQVSNYLVKARKWLRNQKQAQNELALYGGKAFKTSPLYIGELGTLVTINKEAADWKGTTKHFQTEGSFSKADVRKLVAGDEKASLVYYLDHGLGNRLFVGDEFVSSFDIQNAEPREDSLPPLMVSVSCINAAFDESLLLDDTLSDIGQWGVVSIGTALLRSKAGAIAYLGGARSGLGSPETEIDENGNVEVLGTTHGLQLFDGFVDNYRVSNGQKLGDVLIETLQKYSQTQGNDMEEFSHRWTYLITELLGDPLLPINREAKGERGYSLAKSEFEHFDNSTGFPRLVVEEKKEIPAGFPVSKADGPVTAKVFELVLSEDGFSGEKLIKTESLNGNRAASITLNPETELAPGKEYMIKLVNEEGAPRERHIVFSIGEGSK